MLPSKPLRHVPVVEGVRAVGVHRQDVFSQQPIHQPLRHPQVVRARQGHKAVAGKLPKHSMGGRHVDGVHLFPQPSVHLLKKLLVSETEQECFGEVIQRRKQTAGQVGDGKLGVVSADTCALIGGTE